MVRNYKTSSYKMNYMESPTGLKMVLNTDPNANGVPDLVRGIYQVSLLVTCFIPLLD